MGGVVSYDSIHCFCLLNEQSEKVYEGMAALEIWAIKMEISDNRFIPIAQNILHSEASFRLPAMEFFG